jgi:Uma2 family endonuclease
MSKGPTRLVTAEDLLRPDSPWRNCELWDGVPRVCEPTGGWSDEVALRVMGPLGAHVRARGLGWVFASSQGFLLARDPDRVLSPDGAYVARARLPTLPYQGFTPVVPDFALEVRPPTDAWVRTVEKCGIWIAHGAGVVWGIDPRAKSVVIFRPAEDPRLLGPDDVADAAPVLPGFRLPVVDLFRGLDAP